MATKGKAAKSSSGAAMSKYDVEVEARLQALEAQVKEIAAKCDERATSAPAATSTGGDHDKLVEVEASLNKIRGVLGV
tara:strand:- start:3742 stop:3975 length:234 start_codon:yes stop_codon:yes gene_type:complete